MPVHHCNKNNGQIYMQHFYQASDTISQGVKVLAMFMNSTFSRNTNMDCSFNRIIINKFNLKNFLHYCIQAKKMQCTIWLQILIQGFSISAFTISLELHDQKKPLQMLEYFPNIIFHTEHDQFCFQISRHIQNPSITIIKKINQGWRCVLWCEAGLQLSCVIQPVPKKTQITWYKYVRNDNMKAYP